MTKDLFISLLFFIIFILLENLNETIFTIGSNADKLIWLVF